MCLCRKLYANSEGHVLFSKNMRQFEETAPVSGNMRLFEETATFSGNMLQFEETAPVSENMCLFKGTCAGFRKYTPMRRDIRLFGKHEPMRRDMRHFQKLCANPTTSLHTSKNLTVNIGSQVFYSLYFHFFPFNFFKNGRILILFCVSYICSYCKI